MAEIPATALRLIDEARSSGLALNSVPDNSAKIRLVLDLRREIQETGTLRVLDVGCGGRNSPLNLWVPLLPVAARLDVAGVDVAFLDETRTRANELNFPMDVSHASAFELEQRFGASVFDVVVSTQVLEHLQDWRGAVRQMASVLKPGGVLLLTCDSGDLVRPPFDRVRLRGKQMYALAADRAPLLERAGRRLVSGEWERAPRLEELRAATIAAELVVERLEHYGLGDLKDAKGGSGCRLLALAFEESLQDERPEPFDPGRYRLLYLRARRAVKPQE